MKLALSVLLVAATIASVYAPPPTIQLQSDIPYSRFKVKLQYDAPLLPVNPTFGSIMQFLSVLARSGYKDKLQPQSYRTPMYPNIVLTNSDPTEARFLLWGIYLALSDMIKYSRFNNVLVKLFWDKNPVGQINLTVATSLDLPTTITNGTRGIKANGEDSSLVEISDQVRQADERVKAPPVYDVSNSDDAGVIQDTILNRTLDTSSTLSTPQAPSLPNAQLTIDFATVVGSAKLRRNDVFISFCTAMLHIAKFPAEDRLQYFESRAPSVDLSVHMYEVGTGCSVQI